MTSLRHNTDETRPGTAYLDAARDCILDVGWRRTTLTEVARRAGVSRMTIYRTWADMPQLLSDLMTREWGGVVADALADEDPDTPTVERLVGDIVGTVRRLRENELFVRIVDLDPELILPYLLLPARPLAGRDPRAHRRGARARPRPPARSRAGNPVADGPRRCCSPPTASCSRRTRWSTTHVSARASSTTSSAAR